MFRSVFTKYISVFMLILFMSFFVLNSILTTLVNDYNINIKMNSMENAAKSAAEYLIHDFSVSEITDYEDYLYTRGSSVQPAIDLLSDNVDSMVLWVVGSDGQTAFTGGSGRDDIEGNVDPAPNGRYILPDDIRRQLIDEGFVSDRGLLSGFFRSSHCTYGVAIKTTEGEFLGAVVASTNSAGMSELLGNMKRAVLMSTLWIMLAALVAVYFLTERMVAPLKSMSRAAKLFASGKFDARVPVIGSDEIAELATAFNNMADSLAALDEMQRSFIANVSHDLRTPMTTISGFIDGILSGAIPPEKQDYYLGVISSEVRRLSRLVATLLDISRMQAGERKFTMANFDICELARQVLISFEQKIEARKLDVSFSCDSDRMEVCADRDAIHQVLYNICDNAIKFSYEGGKYAINVTEQDKKIRVSVYDEGVGIPESDLSRIFDRFYKSDKSRGLDKTGVGLGMYISRAIIEAHGERIWAESEAGKWCRFTFTLPKGSPAEKNKNRDDTQKKKD